MQWRVKLNRGSKDPIKSDGDYRGVTEAGSGNIFIGYRKKKEDANRRRY